MTGADAAEPHANGAGAEVIPLHAGIDLGATAYFERGDQVELAEKTLTALGPDPLTCDAAEVWRYQPAIGIWGMVAGPRIRTLIATFAGCPIGMGRPRKRKDGSEANPRHVLLSAAAIAGTQKIMMDQLEADERRVTFALRNGPHGVAFSNGFVLVQGGNITIEPHAPEHRARHVFPFAFDRGAACPLLDAFLLDLFRDVDKFERDLRIALLQEYAGACLIGEACRYQRCLVLFAKGGNGKSELLRILRGLFPPDAVTGLVPQWWSDRFRAVMLENKLANFCDELPDADIMGGEAWKLVITGEPIPMERKFRDAFMYPPRAGHIFATNSPIRTTDHSDGFWRRPLVLALTRKFEGDPGRVLEAGQRVLEKEHSGIATWALLGAARAQEQNGYTVPPSSLALTREWRDENDQVRGFVAENPINARVQASDLYKRYVSWAKENGVGAMSSTMFGRRIMAADLADRIDDGRRWYVAKNQSEAEAAEARARAALEAEAERQNCG